MVSIFNGFEKRNVMNLEEKVKQNLIFRGFTKEQLLNNRGLIGAAIDEAALEVVKNINYDALLAVVPDGEIMNAIHKQKPIEPQNGFENAMMKREYVAGFLTAVKWMQERHCS